MTVGERIKEIRTKLGISQVDFADKINVSKQTLYKYENNIITNIPSDKIEAAARIGNVSPAYLMGWSDSSQDTNHKVYVEVNAPSKEDAIFEVVKTMLELNDDMERSNNITKEEAIKLYEIAGFDEIQSTKYEEPTTIAAHLDTDDLTQDELDDVANYIEFIKAKRTK